MTSVKLKPKDKRYPVVKFLIEAGQITTFKQIFDYIPISVVAIDCGSNYVRFKRHIEKSNSFRLRDLSLLASLFGIDFMKMIELVYIEHKKNLGTKVHFSKPALGK